MADRSTANSLNQELTALRARGLTLPKNQHRAAETARDMKRLVTTPGELQRGVSSDLANQFKSASLIKGPSSGDHVRQLESNSALTSAMRRNRGMRRLGSSSDIAVAIPRFYDPLEYWDLSGLPWNMADEGHRHKLHKWLRLYYATHYLVPILIDIFTRFPLVGMNLYCKDKKITEFYEDVFLDRLNYEDFLVGLGREYWTVGEAFPLGSFNEDLGVWEREELLNPEDIVIENFPLLGTSQMKVVPPEYMKRLASTKSPPKEYKQLQENFPELIPYLKRGEPFPVSDVLLKQVAFKITDWDDHGTPILLRGLRTLLHEEKLLASQDAIAERLYSPLILAKLGINDMGNSMGPWIPDGSQLEQFRDDMDVALSSDFRLMVYHYALEVENVFGREQVPDLGNDFDRIERRLMQTFGINPGLLSSGANSQPYASSALNAEFMNQILRTFQKFLKEHFRERALIVAEAQGHYDYEKRGDTRVPIMEEVVIQDEETGELRIEERHKLLIPELEMQVLDLRDEATERQFLQSLRAMGVPISDERMMVGISFEFKDSLDEMQEEMIQKTVAQQMAKLQTYKILKEQGLPIPPDLKAEVESTNAPAGGAPGGPGGAPGGMPGGGGMGGDPGSVDVGAPGGGGGMVMPPTPPGLGPGGIGGTVPGGGPPAAGGLPAGGAGTVPPVSNERRPGMPTASRTLKNPDDYEVPFEELSFEEIDARLASLGATIADIEDQKKMRRMAKSQLNASRFETELPWDRRKESRVVIDRVPPKVRQMLANAGDEDELAV